MEKDVVAVAVVVVVVVHQSAVHDTSQKQRIHWGHHWWDNYAAAAGYRKTITVAVAVRCHRVTNWTLFSF